MLIRKHERIRRESIIRHSKGFASFKADFLTFFVIVRIIR